MHILSIMEKLEDMWSSNITKEKGGRLKILEEKPWLVKLLNRTGDLLVVINALILSESEQPG